MIRSILMALAVVTCLANWRVAAAGEIDWYGDFRFRFESDFDSKQPDGRERDDRDRARIRLRVGMKYKPSDAWELGFRIRSGSDDNQQSPHITIADFSGNPTGDEDFNLDKWYARHNGENSWIWIGRNSYPFWKPYEMFWDDDAIPIGVAGQMGRGDFQFTAGYFQLPAGLQNTAGEMLGIQVRYSSAPWTIAAGYFQFDGDPGDPDSSIYLQGNGARDYGLFQAHVVYQTEVSDRPLSFGFDFSHNDENYGLADGDFAFENRDETDGFAVSARYGSTANKGDWLVGYWYADVEQFAVNNSFSQDDWLRWGSATQTRSSNFHGHEIRYARNLTGKWNAVARLYLVDALTTIEDGNRFRLDFNRPF